MRIRGQRIAASDAPLVVITGLILVFTVLVLVLGIIVCVLAIAEMV